MTTSRQMANPAVNIIMAILTLATLGLIRNNRGGKSWKLTRKIKRVTSPTQLIAAILNPKTRQQIYLRRNGEWVHCEVWATSSTDTTFGALLNNGGLLNSYWDSYGIRA